MKSLIVTFLLLTIYYLFSHCSENSTKPPPPVIEQRDTITISIEQTTHRSISLRLIKKLKITNDQYVLNRIFGSDTSDFVILTSDFTDTLIIDDDAGAGLAIDSEYSYFAYRLDSTATHTDTSNFVTARTLPGTSHDFSWTEYIVGDGGELRDVWGSSPDNVYACGTVSIGDSTFGVLKWNGAAWRQEVYTGGKNGIFGLTEENIYVVGNGGVLYFDGLKWTEISDNVIDNNVPYYSVWGTSSNNMYFGSGQGTIVHWDGEKGSLEDVQANEIIRDIWGFSTNNIYACAGTVSGSRASQLFYYNGNKWNLIIESDLSQEPGKLVGAFWSVWGFEPNLLYMSGDRIHTLINNNWSSLRLSFFIDKIRGQQANNIIAAGQFGGVAHFNGVDWLTFTELPVANSDNIYKSNWFTDNTVFLAGENLSGEAIILKGIQN